MPKIVRFYIFDRQAALAQLVEHLICNQAVSGSSPLGGSTTCADAILVSKKQRVMTIRRNPFCMICLKHAQALLGETLLFLEYYAIY